MTMKSIQILLLACATLGLLACGSPPSSTRTTTTTSTAQTEGGGEVHRESTETHEVAADGAETTDTHTTETTTPAE